MSDAKLLEFEAYLFDLDGTLYLGETLIAGADRAIARLRAAGKRVAFISNKPIATCEEYAAKLTRLGIPVEASEVINSPVALALFLKQQAPQARLLVLVEQPVVDELRKAGLEIVQRPEEADAVVVSWDRAVTYEKLSNAAQALQRGARFFATNPDVACPTPEGLVPDTGAFIAFLEAATGRKVEQIAGKPDPLMLQVVLDKFGVPPERALLIGDRLETDIALGEAAGCATALVLTGATRREHLESSPLQPDFVLESVVSFAVTAAYGT